MAEVGGYDLHLYCDDPTHTWTPENHGRHPGLFSGPTLACARREARAAGWRMVRHSAFPVREGNAPRWICPWCAAERFPVRPPVTETRRETT